MIKYQKATLKDVSLMQNLVKDEIEQGIILLRNDDEVATNIRSYILAKNDNKIVGFLALHIHTTSLSEIRSLVVDKQKRNQGIAKGLIQEAIKEALNLELKKILVLTYQKALFEKFDFKEIDKETLPEHKVWSDCIRCQHFPVCNEIALIKKL